MAVDTAEPQEPIPDAERLRSPDTVMEPDQRTVGRLSLGHGGFRRATLADHHAEVAHYVFVPEVPRRIVVHFETAKNLWLYAWFVFRFYPVAERHGLATLEYALRERLTELARQPDGPASFKVPRGLKPLLHCARARGLIDNSAFPDSERLARVRARERAAQRQIEYMFANNIDEMEWDESAVGPEPQDYAYDWLERMERALPRIRNELSHGSSLMSTAVSGTFSAVTGLVNQLYGQGANGT